MRALRVGPGRPDSGAHGRLVVERTDLLVVLGLAVLARVAFLLLLSNTYDFDEFVILLLARDVSHGAVPYRDFMFFHPPGILLLVRSLQWVIALWWPAARLATAALDSCTAVLVWRIGSRLFGRRAGLAAGVFYAVNPLALISAGRVGQDSIVTFVGVAGLYALLLVPGRSLEARTEEEGATSGSHSSTPRYRALLTASIAGICLGIAVWIKYPALYFLPLYVLANPRRTPVMLVAAVCTVFLLFLPFRAEWGALFQQTVTFQRTRWTMPLADRFETAALYWLVVNPLAVVTVLRFPRPRWLVIGFLAAGLFVASPQVYYHYFVPLVPIASLLAAPLALRLWERAPRRLVGISTPLVCLWGAIVALGGSSPLYVTAAHLSSLKPTVAFLDQMTHPEQPVLADRYEYAYLARRPALAHYFWNVGVLVRANYLERRVGRAGAVVLSRGASSGYPSGFARYLDDHYRPRKVGATTVWLVLQGAEYQPG